MLVGGAECLQANVERINALNVFPVPDGDTGTNMNMTMTAGIRELQGKPSPAAGKVAEALSKGLLMGARGNSGVILSQLFRGFSRSLAGVEEAGTVQFAAALQSGVDMAYKAVVKPVEGTILTVAREAAKHAAQAARRTSDMEPFMREVHAKALEALQRTPELLPVLKQVGVVDSGGQGLVCIYEGFLRALEAEGGERGPIATADPAGPAITGGMAARPAAAAAAQSPATAQSRLSTDAITFFYDMEFMIRRRLGGRFAPRFDEESFKRQLARDGDSILVIADEDVIKVHVHTRRPGDVLNYALPYGELTDFHILNMREQHRSLGGAEAGGQRSEPSGGSEPANATAAVEAAALGMAVPEVLTGTPAGDVPTEQAHELAPYGIIAVALGEGIGSIFLENNVDIVLSGGQTMNPSTEDFVNAIEQLQAEHIFILPNNGNIILSARQAAELSERNVTVIPTKTIPQGLAAALAFRDDEGAEANAEAMTGASSLVRSGQVTTAVRDTAIDGVEIKEGDYIGILEKAIICSSPDMQDACRELLAVMLEDGGELVTILTGEEAVREDTESLVAWARETFPEAEFEVHEGGQPLYPYLIAAE
ncbi:DAK2 domain-containing protein [Paenibacillus humicola]|uniref:DAK2 domain-containing protein n=1 Tax=Paenibacillus humicola TaxID=3110540 RepID=UPI00237AC8C4|nr:DAK2 domain-containing protein [Paenibacillus humicola]